MLTKRPTRCQHTHLHACTLPHTSTLTPPPSHQILGNNECFEPYTSNIYVRRVLSGEFTIVNQHLLHDLNRLGLWNPAIKNELVRPCVHACVRAGEGVCQAPTWAGICLTRKEGAGGQVRGCGPLGGGRQGLSTELPALSIPACSALPPLAHALPAHACCTAHAAAATRAPTHGP